MPNKTQVEYTRLFENIGAAVSGFKRYLEAANLVGSSSYFALRQRDEFVFFTDLPDQLRKIKNLKRAIGYASGDDVLRLEISEVTPGATFSLNFVLAFGGTAIAAAAGAYDTDVTITPQLGQDLSPVGSIKITAPTGTPGAAQRVEILIVPSAPRQLWDVTGETEAEQLAKATAQEAHGIGAESLRTPLLSAARQRVFNDRIGALIGDFLGSSNAVLFEENQEQQSDGSVTAAPAGLLVELDNAMGFNTPEQWVKSAVVASTTFSALAAGGSLGDFTVTPTDPALGTLRLDCIRGFIGGTPDPEQFRVSYRSEALNRTVSSDIPYSVYTQYVWTRAGLTWTLKRKTTSDDTFGRMTVPELKKVSESSVPLNRLSATYVKPGGVNNPNGLLTITEPKKNFRVFTQSGSIVGAQSLRLSNGAELTFTWVENPSVAAGDDETFDINIFPYVVGDIVEAEVTQSVAGGLLQLEMRRNFDFAFSQSVPFNETIDDGIVSPDLPFVIPFLGA